MIFKALSVGGRPELPPEATAFLLRYDKEPVWVTVEPVYSRRTLPQLRRYFAGVNRAVKELASLTQYEVPEVHDALKNRSEVIQPVRLYFPNGELIGEAKTTKTLPVPRMSDYMEEVTALFARGGLNIYPEEL